MEFYNREDLLCCIKLDLFKRENVEYYKQWGVTESTHPFVLMSEPSFWYRVGLNRAELSFYYDAIDAYSALLVNFSDNELDAYAEEIFELMKCRCAI